MLLNGNLSGFMSGGIMSPDMITVSLDPIEAYAQKLSTSNDYTPFPSSFITDHPLGSPSVEVRDGRVPSNGSIQFSTFLPTNIQVSFDGNILAEGSGSGHTVAIHLVYYGLVLDGQMVALYEAAINSSWGSGGSAALDTTVSIDRSDTIAVSPGTHTLNFVVIARAAGNAVQPHEGRAWTRATLQIGNTLIIKPA